MKSAVLAASQAETSLVPRATFLDTLRFLADVILPTISKGVILRRPRMVAIAEYLDLDRRAVRRMQRLRDRYGDGPLLIRLPGRTLAVILDPRHVQRVLAESPEPFSTASLEKRAALAHFEPKNVLLSEGDERAQRRRFHDQALDSDRSVHHLADSFLEVVSTEAEYLMTHLRHMELTWDDFSKAWFRIVRRIIFGPAARDDEQLTCMMAELRSAANWAFLRPQKKHLRDRLFQRIGGYLKQAHPDSLASVMARYPLSGAIAPEHQVPQWLFAFDPAGMATFRALALLATHREQYNLAREEITRDRRRQYQPYLRAAVLESLRLWPTSPLVLREATRPTFWDSGAIPAHSSIVIFTPFFHRDNERLPYADRFSPELWTNDHIEGNQSIIPFSEGPAICPGRHLVLLLTSAMLAAILERGEMRIKSAGRLNSHEPLPGTLNPYRLQFQVRD